ncbi:MAG: hypothetical protein H0U85_09365, partial [Gemmatimonadales bacterium]|nr:hypothetical protein [Gemmatimonadales bacterium]
MSSQTVIVPGWGKLMASLAVPALVIGVFLYPDPQHGGMPLPLAVLIVLLAAAGLVMAGRPRLLVLLPVIAAFLPSAQVGFVGYVIALGYFTVEYGATRLATPLDRLDWALLAVLAWTVVSWAANLGVQTDAWSLLLFSITFLSPWLLVLVARVATWDLRDISAILAAWIALAAVQAVPALVKPLVLGMGGAYSVPLVVFQLTGVALLRNLMPTSAADLTTGTTITAHHLGSALLLLCMLLLSWRIAARIRGWPILLAFYTYIFLMTDAKHMILAALPAGIWYLGVVVWPLFARRTRRWMNVAAAVVVAGGGGYVAAQVAAVVREFWQPYMALASVNPKAQLFSRTARLMGENSLQTWIGFGPGAFGSRAASIRATDVLFKEDNRLPSFITPHTAPAYASVAYDLYTSEIVRTEAFRSGALTSPFSSLVGVVAEYGILGSMVVAWFLFAAARAAFSCWRNTGLPPAWRAAGATAGFAIPFLMALSPFDTYFE